MSYKNACIDSLRHICVNKLAVIGSDNGLSPGRRQTVIWTNAGILLFVTLGTNFTETWSTSIFIQEMHWKCHLENGGHFVSASMCWMNVVLTKYKKLYKQRYGRNACKWSSATAMSAFVPQLSWRWILSASRALFSTRKHFEGILPKGPYPPCVSMVDRSLLAEYHPFRLCMPFQ